jgi:hypothetical protein
MGLFKPKIVTYGKTIAPGASTDSSYTENVVILPANAYVLAKFGRVKTAFTGLTKPKVCLGVSGDTDKYMIAQPVDAINEFIMGPPARTNDAILGLKDFCVKMDKEKIAISNRTIIATFTSSSTDFSGLTAGEVEFIVVYVDPNEY